MNFIVRTYIHAFLRRRPFSFVDTISFQISTDRKSTSPQEIAELLSISLVRIHSELRGKVGKVTSTGPMEVEISVNAKNREVGKRNLRVRIGKIEMEGGIIFLPPVVRVFAGENYMIFDGIMISFPKNFHDTRSFASFCREVFSSLSQGKVKDTLYEFASVFIPFVRACQ